MTRASKDPFGPDAIVGPYRLLREIGRGGMGRVLLARDTSAGDRQVAVKILLADTAHRALLEARFAREVRNLARLRHPGIVTILDAGTFADHPYLVMEHVAGRDLREFLFEGATLPGAQRIARIVRVIAQVAHAVEHAHRHGVAHRDIKPSNVRVAAGTDQAVLLDFGISKCLDDAGLTGIEVPGTALYMAPEQLDVRMHASDHLIDVWALGVTLYFALTGELPFKGDTPLALSHDVVHGEPEFPTRINGRISRELEELMLGCMRKDPRARIQSAGEVARTLDDVLARGAACAAPSAVLPPSRPAADAPTLLGTTFAAPSSAARAARAPQSRRRGLARVVVGLCCLALLLVGGDGRAVATSDAAAPALRDGSELRPLDRTPSLAVDPRVRTLLAADDAMARSVLLYTTDVDVQSRRSLLGALGALAEDRVGAALPRLRAFVHDNPKSSLVALARFWIATTLLLGGEAAEAARGYAEIVSDARRSQFAPRALLFAAAAHAALGDARTGDALLRRLAAEYPASPAARDADEPLRLF